MVKVEDIEVGALLYYNQPLINSGATKVQKEFEGEIWYRYIVPTRTYVTKSGRVVGILKKNVIGVWDDNHDYMAEIQITPNGKDITTVYEYELEDYFLTEEEAINARD